MEAFLPGKKEEQMEACPLSPLARRRWVRSKAQKSKQKEHRLVENIGVD